MAKTLNKADAEELLRGADREKLYASLRRLPDDVDAELVVARVQDYLDSPWFFARQCGKLPAHVLRELLGRLESRVTSESDAERSVALITTLLVDGAANDEELARAWARALKVILELNLSSTWGSKKRRETFAALAREADVLEALRAIAVSGGVPSLDVLAVLAADGSAASIDALLPELDAAIGDGPRLLQLTRLRKHANLDAPAMRALIDELDTRLEERSEKSPALSLATSIGVAVKDVFWLRASVSSTLLNGSNVSRYQGHLNIDSRRARWYQVNMVKVSLDRAKRLETRFDARGLADDGLRLGSCEPHQLPTWLGSAATTLGVEWRLNVSSSVRGKKRTQLADWLTVSCSQH